MAEKLKVLIPTSGLGSRLGGLTKYTNKALAKVGDKPVISHIIDMYPNADFVITLGYKGSLVKQFLEIAYPERNFQFVWVNPFEGEGSGLLKSMSFAREFLQCPFVFHACDTIVRNVVVDRVTSNWLGCGVSTRADLFRTVSAKNNLVETINEKGEMFYDYVLIGVCGILDYELFWGTLERMLVNGPPPDQSDCHVYREMLKEEQFHVKKIDDWHDTGSVENLLETRKYFNESFTVLDKQDEAIFFVGDSVIKFFSDEKIVQNRVLRASLLRGLVPEVASSSGNFYKYRIASGELLANVLNEEIVSSLLDWAEDKLWTVQHDLPADYPEKVSEFYKTKTDQRAGLYLEQVGAEDCEMVINGDLVPSYKELLNRVCWDKLCPDSAYRFHGDFIADNILVNDSGFILLDWRQDFAGYAKYGDIYYDLAKFNHNLIFNHGIISAGNFKIENKGHSINCDVLRSHRLTLCHERFMQEIVSRGYNVDKVDILTALIWISMAPLHEYPVNKLLFNFGKWNLWKKLTK